MWRKVDNLWISTLQAFLSYQKKALFSRLFRQKGFCTNCSFSTGICPQPYVYPQYPVVDVEVCTQCIRITGAFPSFSAYSCVKLRMIFPREKSGYLSDQGNKVPRSENDQFKCRNPLIQPRFQGAKAQLRLRRTRALKANFRFFRILIPPRRFRG